MKEISLYMLLCLVSVHLCLGGSASSSAGAHHPINDDKECMNTPLRSLTYLRRSMKYVDLGRWHHAALRGVSELTRCGTISMEKGNDKTTSPYGKSQAIRWGDVKSKYRKTFKEVRTSSTNPRKVTPHQLLVAMGTKYHWDTDNCQRAAQNGWDKWHGVVTPVYSEKEILEFSRNDPTECCGNTAWALAADRVDL